MSGMMAPSGRFAGRNPFTAPRWWHDLLWRLHRRRKYLDCLYYRRHVLIECEIPSVRAGTSVRVMWCPACSRLEWLD